MRKYTKAAQRSALQFSFTFVGDVPAAIPAQPTRAASPTARPNRRLDAKTFAAAPAGLRARDSLLLTRWLQHATTAPTAQTAQLARDAARVIVRSATRISAQTDASALDVAVAAATHTKAALDAWTPTTTDATQRATLDAGPMTGERLARRSAGARRVLQRVATRSQRATDTAPTWNTQTLEADLGSLRDHWGALVAWLQAAVEADNYPTWEYAWRGESPSWVMTLAAPTRHRVAKEIGARLARRTQRVAA